MSVDLFSSIISYRPSIKGGYISTKINSLSSSLNFSMDPVDILLFEEGDANSGFRTKNVEGDRVRSVLIDRGDVLAVRASLASVTHGDYTPDGDAATLLVFEFSFLSMKQSRRFKTAKIILTFEDASGNLRNRPEVVTVVPAGKFFINKTTDERDVKHSANASLDGSAAGAGGSLGYTWEMSQTQKTDHATTLVGTKRLFTDWGKVMCLVGATDLTKLTYMMVNRTMGSYGPLRRMGSRNQAFPASSELPCYFGGGTTCHSASPSRLRWAWILKASSGDC